jgi:hypothetical protein
MLEIGPCDYLAEIQPLAGAPALNQTAALALRSPDKSVQNDMLTGFVSKLRPVAHSWRAAETAHDAAAVKKG